ncbi:putative Agenet-like domain-containing protein [Rosa chinensis]|uniref:Putative Agenet-like domain-containing protein n=1 Tax=Rosa chinensis TaxID=74649 RepID=A0A2P6PGT5_ROSCH|nr:putative Agenet-like domain-containing protein [Rosa chinensis]
MGYFSFQKGNQFEVCSKLDGFLGSYYKATVVANMGTNYVIQYKNLVEEFNDSVSLKETIKAPSTISSEENGSGHQSVFFETTGQELDYPVLKLMVHQDWRNGKWVSSKKTKRNAVR